MKWRGLLLFGLLLISHDGGAKKLYKFQDDKGIWHYSDKPPETERKMEVRQLTPAPKKQRVSLMQGGEKHHPVFYAVNQYPGPIELEVDWENQHNAMASPPLPRHFVIGPGRSADLFAVQGAVETQSWRFSLQYRYMIGEPLPDYSSPVAYLPPLPPDGRFQISQAFNGEFSHHDQQNRYAVDIMMPVGTPVHAARGGLVVEVEDDYFKSGTIKAYANKANSIRILHDDGSMAIYAHLQLEKAQVHPGLQVQAGELIAYSGNTGYSSGPHLHFVVQINQGMKLVAVPFEFADAGGGRQTPQQGQWLTGFKP